MFRSAFPHARSPKAGHAHARSGKAFDYMAISGLLSNRIRDHPALAGQIRMPYVPGFHQNTLSSHSARYCTACATCRAPSCSAPSRSAIARHPQRPVQHAGRAAQAAHGLPAAAPARSRPARNGGPVPRRPGPRWACPDVPIAAHGRPGPAHAPPPRPPRRPVQLFRGHRRQAQMQVDAVQQGAETRPRSAPPGPACRRRPAPVPAPAAGAGFMAATSWKRAGKRAVRMAREISTRPVSSGSRSDSSVRRLNSGSSSRNSTP